MRVAATLVLTATLLAGADAGWLEVFAQQLCRTEIRCYTKTYQCAQILNVFNMQQSMLNVLSYCRSLLGSSTLRQPTLTPDDLFDVMNNVHGEQLPECVLKQSGVVTEGEVNQAAIYLALAGTAVSGDPTKQNTFYDAVSKCPEPIKSQLPSFFACVMQGCVQAL
ncbi:uncharacterized protein [Procambarus clarkii]|uniref:uncharacterized protein n=1 Tax=Procambarus clarkii TaxID=6728 RepID=UPI001E6765E6|nr:uncharacterized protein LOC123747348 [Procambarus clarkii]